jgi:hypothetical protein
MAVDEDAVPKQGQAPQHADAPASEAGEVVGWTEEPLVADERSGKAVSPPGLVRRGLRAMVGAGVSVATLPLKVAKPMIMSDVLSPARNAANSAVSVVVDAGASIIAEQLAENPEVADLVAYFTDKLLRALANDPLTGALVRTQASAFVKYVEENPSVVGPMVDAVVDRTLTSLRRNPAGLHALARVVAGDYIAYLARNPYLIEGVVDGAIEQLEQRPEVLDELVQRVAVRFLEAVEENPAPVESVVKLVGDRYVDHLNENPETVQELLAGQTMDIATDIVVGVREVTVAGDAKLEHLVRRFLRMKPRTDDRMPAEPTPGLRAGDD